MRAAGVRRGRLPAGGLLLIAAAAAAAQEPPLLEHARIDPRRVVTAEACGECHASEHQVWKATPHATGFRTLHRKQQALTIAGKLGFRLIKRDSICFSCHYTPVVEDGRIRVDSGISCESCHGPGRDWINLHNDYGDGFDHRSEPAAHRRQRIAASRAAGMRRPSDLYGVVANCFSCHTVPNERLVNVGGHTTGSDGFEFVEWSQGEIRHNFLASSLAGAAPVNAQRPLSRKRVMFVVGRALELEYALRGVAAASEDGVYAKAMVRRVRSAVSEMRAIDRTGAVPQAAEMLDVVRGVEVRPRNEAALVAAAERVAAAARRFFDEALPERLAALDDLVLGREPPEPVAGQLAAAVDPDTGEPAGPGASAPAAAGGAPAAAGGGSRPAAGSGSRSAAPAAAAGPIKRRLRPASRHRTLGPGACSGCHTSQNEWWFQDSHYRSADPFFDGNPDNVRLATLYGLRPSDSTVGRNLCMDCHGTVISGKESREVLDGVSCESCHGSAGDWLEPHKDETDKHLGRGRPGHRAALAGGKADLRDLSVRASACTSCHYVTDPRLLSAGHPSGADFDYAEGMRKVRHWQSGPAPTSAVRAAIGAVVAARGPVPSVRRAVLAAGGGTGASSSRPAGGARPGTASGGRSAPQPAVLALRPPPPRPALAAASGAGPVAGIELPDLPEISQSAPVDEVLRRLQERLALLYRLVREGAGGGS